jgi:hypothetical protein
MGLCAALTLGGCAEDKAAKIARDPYLPTMMKDPLFTWRPEGDASRTESLSPKSTDQLASGTAVSGILITLIYRNAGDPKILLDEALRIAADEGYVNSRRSLLPGVSVSCSIAVLKDVRGIGIHLTAPV